MDILVVVDMQKDFISGALGTKEAVGIVPRVAEKIAQAKKAGKTIVFTRDTHHENYMDTQEGKNLPVPHCIENTDGWQLDPALDTAGAMIFDKPSFGSEALVRYLKSLPDLQSAEFVGLCTDICVITNVLSAKCALPELPMAFAIAASWFVASVPVAVVLLVAAGVLAVCRVLGGVHFPRDVVAGALIGSATGALAAFLAALL